VKPLTLPLKYWSNYDEPRVSQTTSGIPVPLARR
jgi:hypothetical protein